MLISQEQLQNQWTNQFKEFLYLFRCDEIVLPNLVYLPARRQTQQTTDQTQVAQEFGILGATRPNLRVRGLHSSDKCHTDSFGPLVGSSVILISLSKIYLRPILELLLLLDDMSPITNESFLMRVGKEQAISAIFELKGTFLQPMTSHNWFKFSAIDPQSFGNTISPKLCCVFSRWQRQMNWTNQLSIHNFKRNKPGWSNIRLHCYKCVITMHIDKITWDLFISLNYNTRTKNNWLRNMCIANRNPKYPRCSSCNCQQ